jgi:hypothetical protein
MRLRGDGECVCACCAVWVQYYCRLSSTLKVCGSLKNPWRCQPHHHHHPPSPSTQQHRVNQHGSSIIGIIPPQHSLLRLLQNCTPIICLPPFSQWSNTCHCSRRSWPLLLLYCCQLSSYSSSAVITAVIVESGFPLRTHSSSKYFVFIIIILSLIQYFY